MPAGLWEFGGGVLTGLLNPLGPIWVRGSVATSRARWVKPIRVTEGGAEHSVTNVAVSTRSLTTGI